MLLVFLSVRIIQTHPMSPDQAHAHMFVVDAAAPERFREAKKKLDRMQEA